VFKSGSTLEAQFWVTATDSTEGWKIMWNENGASHGGSVPVTLKTTSPTNLRVEFKGWEIRFVERIHWVDTLRRTQTVQVGIDVDQKQSDGMALVAKEVMKGKEYMR
jgi:hypothetical protein